ncbi:MAG: ADP-ribosylation factor-like protein [Candidatus Helarchaeota archaeon]
MLKNITIFSNKVVYLNKDYAVAFKNEKFLEQFLLEIDEEMTVRGYYDEEMVLDILSLKIIAYKIKDPLPLFLALTFDDSIDPVQVFDKLQDLIDITLEYIESTDSVNENKNPKALEMDCDEIINGFLSIRPPKIAVIGDDGVGKTTICELIKSGIMADEGVQPITVEKYFGQLFGIPIELWDVKISTKDWKSSSKFLLGSDAIIIVLDSTLKNVRYSKPFLEMTAEVVPHAELLVVANKQDAPDALTPEEIEDILGVKVFPFVANKVENQKAIQIQAAKLLELKGPDIDYSEEDYVIHRD